MTKRNRKITEEQKDAELQSEQHSSVESDKPTINTEKKQHSDAPTSSSKGERVKKDPLKKNATPDKTDHTSNSWPGKLAILIAILALALAAFLYNQARINNAIYSAALGNISELESKLANSVASSQKIATEVKSQVSTSISAVEAKLENLQSATATKEQEINALQLRLTKSIQQVEASTQQRNSRKDWLLAEVEYLLRLANQRVLMENSPIGALALLKSADQILVQADDVALFSVRKTLAVDIAALEAVPNIDQEGIYLKLDAMSELIDQLKLVPLTDKKQLPSILNDVASEAISEQGTLSKIWQKASSKLEKLVVINHRSEAIEPLLSPAQQAGLLQNLHILFEQAQLSLLQQKPQAFSRSLAKAQVIIGNYFQIKDGTTQALLKGLTELEGVQISAVLPSIAGSLNTLKAHLQQASEIRAGASE